MGTILIIEDDELSAVLMINALRRFGLELIHAGTANEGLHLAKTQQPSLILLDMRLPGMNGWELAAVLKKDAQLRWIPIIAVSVETGAEDVVNAIHAGCNEFLPKPFELKLLRERVAAYLLEGIR